MNRHLRSSPLLPVLSVTLLAFVGVVPGVFAAPPAVEFAQRDLERARLLADAANEQAKSASQSPELAAVAAAEAAKKSLDALLAKRTAELQTTEAARKKSASALAATEQAAAKAQAAVDAATAQLTKATAAERQAASLRDRSRNALALAEADLAKAKEAKADGEIDARELLVTAARTQLASAESAVAKAVETVKRDTASLATTKTAFANAETQVAAATAELGRATGRVEAAKAQRDEAKTLVDQAAQLLEKVKKQAQPAVEAEKAAAQQAAKAKALLAAATARHQRVSEHADPPDPKALHEIAKYTFARPAIAVRFEPTGRSVVAGVQEKTLHRQDLLTSERTTMSGHRTWVRRLALQGDDLLVSGDYSGGLAWWDPSADSPEPTRVVDAHEGYVRGVAVSPDRRFVASGGNDGFVRVWDAGTGQLVAEMDGHQRLSKVAEYADTPQRVFVNHVYNVAFDPTGRYLVSGDLVGVVKTWEVGTWKPVRDLDASPLHVYDKTFRAHCGGIRGIDFSPDGKLVAVCGIGEVTNAFAGVGKPTACVFDVESGERLAVLKPAANFQGACWSIRFHPSGEWLVGAGGGGSGSLWFWKPTEEKSFHAVKTPHVAYDVDFHPDGLRLAVALYDKTVRLYDLLPATKPAPATPAK